MLKIFESFGLIKTNGLLGIEVECEGKNLNTLYPEGNCVWRTEDDASLRGDYPRERSEFVLSKPVSLPVAREQLVLLADAQKNAGVNFSFRTSVHVHLNVQEFTEEEVMTFIYTYYLLESVLLRYCGESRQANRFCLSIKDADGVLETLTEVYSEGVYKALFRVDPNRVRYAALNLSAVRKYGSLEVRSMRGTLEYDVLNTWITALANLHKHSTKGYTVMDIYDMVVNQGADKFVKTVLGAEAYKEMAYEGMENDILHHMSLTMEIPYLYNIYKRKLEAPKAQVPKIPRVKKDPVIDDLFDPEQAPPLARRRVVAENPVLEILFPDEDEAGNVDGDPRGQW